MPPPKKTAPSSLKVLGGRVDRIALPDVLSSVESCLEQGRFLQIVTVNTLMLLESENDPELQAVFQNAGIVAADSVGIAMAAGLKGFRIERIPGIDLMGLLCGRAVEKGWPVYLLGARPGVAERAGEALKRRFPGLKLCGARHGYFDPLEEREILEDIRGKRPRLVFAGLSIPFQEKWISRNAGAFAGACVMGVGGSLDVLSGDLKRAPAWVQKVGLEWLFRLIQEPWRWRRVLRLPLFIFKVLLERIENPRNIS